MLHTLDVNKKTEIINSNGVSMEYRLSFARYRFYLRATKRITFQDYSGSAWRGLFGHSLKRSVCITRERRCKNCMLFRNCVYSWVFETPPPENSEHMRLYRSVPHPFVLMPDPALRELNPGEGTGLTFTLIGEANKQLPYIVHAMTQAENTGIGPARGTFKLIHILQETVPGSDNWTEIYEDQALKPLPVAHAAISERPDAVTMDIKTPIRLKHKGHLMNPENFEFAGIAGNLLRRMSSLFYFYEHSPLQTDFKALIQAAQHIKPLSQNLSWQDWTRRSSRQQKSMQMGGIIGQVRFAGQDIADFWPLLWLGQWLHLGKATSMGLGNYRLHATQSKQNQAA